MFVALFVFMFVVVSFFFVCFLAGQEQGRVPPTQKNTKQQQKTINIFFCISLACFELFAFSLCCYFLLFVCFLLCLFVFVFFFTFVFWMPKARDTLIKTQKATNKKSQKHLWFFLFVLFFCCFLAFCSLFLVL